MNIIAKTFSNLSTQELYEILKARAKIFIMEQKIQYQDMDNIDYESIHCFFMDHGQVIAYLRVYYDDEEIVKIGRVLTIEHNKGIGKELMKQSINMIQEKMKCKRIILDAQKHAIGFYEKLNFKIISDEFLEENIIHVKMALDINNKKTIVNEFSND